MAFPFFTFPTKVGQVMYHSNQRERPFAAGYQKADPYFALYSVFDHLYYLIT